MRPLQIAKNFRDVLKMSYPEDGKNDYVFGLNQKRSLFETG